MATASTSVGVSAAASPPPPAVAAAGTSGVYRVVTKQQADELASISGMPFGQLGVGTALTAGIVLSADPAKLEALPASERDYWNAVAITDAPPEAAASDDPVKVGALVQFHSAQMEQDVLRETYTRFAAIKGKGAAAAGPKVSSQRALVAFPSLADSDIFLRRLKKDVPILLDAFAGKWTDCLKEAGTDPEKLQSLNIVQVFEDVWLHHGWHHCHLCAGESAETREAIYDNTMRGFLSESRGRTFAP